MNGFEKTRNDIKAYVRSLNTPDNEVYQNNQLLILSCFNKAMELIEENENLALGKTCVSGRSKQLASCNECGYWVNPNDSKCLREGCKNY